MLLQLRQFKSVLIRKTVSVLELSGSYSIFKENRYLIISSLKRFQILLNLYWVYLGDSFVCWTMSWLDWKVTSLFIKVYIYVTVASFVQYKPWNIVIQMCSSIWIAICVWGTDKYACVTPDLSSSLSTHLKEVPPAVSPHRQEIL